MTMSRLPLLLLLAVLASGSAQATALLPGDAARGKALHAQHCTGCHDTGVYTRSNRRVKTVEGLMGQVRLCDTQLKKRLSKDDIDDLVRHLNDSYYRFD